MDLLFLVSLWLFFLVLLYYAQTDLLRLLFLSALGALLFLSMAVASMICWVFKDGIAPDAGYSEGWEAWVLFFEMIWQFALLVMIFVVAGYFANRKAKQRIEADRNPQDLLLEL